MHFIEDTEQEDSVGELFWKEDYKKILREKLPKTILLEMMEDPGLNSIYERLYTDTFSSYEAFIRAISSIVTIGCENGADEAFDDIYLAFAAHSPLPEARRFSEYCWSEISTAEMTREVKESLISEYGAETSFISDYEDYYSHIYPKFSAFMNTVAEFVVAGATNGADDMVGRLYRSFILELPLPPARRRPKRLKGW
jgi:hypothetical protein